MQVNLATNIEIKNFSENSTPLILMKALDHILGQNLKSESHYLSLISGKSAKNIRAVYFKELDQSNISFLARWVAKLAYRIFSSMAPKKIENAIHSLFQPRTINSTSFDTTINEQLKKSNPLIKGWIEALQNVAKNASEDTDLKTALKAELQNPKYYNGKSPEEFYQRITETLIDENIPKISTSEMMVNAGFSSTSKLAFLNIPLKCITLPVALLLYLTLSIPESFVNRAIANKLKKTLCEKQLLQNLIPQIINVVTSNPTLSTAILKTGSQILEELLGEIEKDVVCPEFSEETMAMLLQNKMLTQEALEFFHQEKVSTLKTRIKNGPPLATRFADRFNPEVTKGLARVILKGYAKSANPTFVKEKIFHLISGINSAFESPSNASALEEEKARFFTLFKKVATTSVQKSISEKLGTYWVPQTFSKAPVSHLVHDTVEKSVAMMTSPEYLSFFVRATLNEITQEKTS